MSTMEQFKTFLAEYGAAMQAADQSALRRTLPPGIPGEHFDFLMQMNQGFFAQVAAAGIEPQCRQDGDRFIAHYELEDEDGEETMEREFWWHDDRWVSYDPSDDEGG